MENDREVIGEFGLATNPRRYKPNAIGLTVLFLNIIAQPFIHARQLMKLRAIYKSKKKSQSLSPNPTKANPSLSVVIVADTLDEINGISNSSRQLVSFLKKQNKSVTLLGTVAYPAKTGKREKSGAILVPQTFSTAMVGYEDSEFSIPSMKEILRFWQRYPVDLVELETPTPGCMIALLFCKIIGVPVISHYRTDALGYTNLLTSNTFQQLWVKYWTMLFCHFTKPVIVPSQEFKQKLINELRLQPNDIQIIRRGIRIENYSPQNREHSEWNLYFPACETPSVTGMLPENTNTRPMRFLYVGRVSKEKELPFLANCWKVFNKSHPNCQLLVVGHGPYEKEMQGEFTNTECEHTVHFTGRLQGQALYTLYAQADVFIFPSGTDTFGNVVVESLASGTPVLVSDHGGPKEIITPECGLSLPFREQQPWLEGMEQYYNLFFQRPQEYQQLRIQARLRGEYFSLKEAGDDLWAFYEKLAHKLKLS